MTPLTIPEAAQPIAELIREKVPRPAAHEVHIRQTGVIRFRSLGAAHCPMGLLPCAWAVEPTTPEDFDRENRPSEDEIVAFYLWWDAQRDAEAAMDAVWGEPKEVHPSNCVCADHSDEPYNEP